MSPDLVRLVRLYVLSIAAALALCAVLVLAVGHSPWSVLSALYDGSLSSGGAVGRTLDATTPVVLVALGTLVAVRAGMFNIGQTGQLVVGASAAAAVALKVPGPGPLVLLLALLAGTAAGACWAGIAAVLGIWRRVSVVISTLLLTYVATQLVDYLVSSPHLLKQPGASTLPQTADLPAGVRLPHPGTYPSFGVGIGLFVAVGLLVVVGVALARTPWGLRLRSVGANPLAARRFGVRVGVVAGGALLVSGALAGLAGSVMLTGQSHYLGAGFADTYGNDGLLAALVCRDRPGWLLPVSLVFGVIRTGGGFLLSTGVPSYLGQVLRALLVLAAVFPPVFVERREWARRLRLAAA